MAREIKISGESVNITRQAEVGQFEEMQKVGRGVSAIGDKIIQASTKSKAALSKAQTSKNGTLQNTAWEGFNAEQKDKYNEETYNQLSDSLYSKQKQEIENNKELTKDSRKMLLDNLDVNKASSLKLFNGSIAQAETKAALNDSEEEIAFHVRSGDSIQAKRVVDQSINSGLIHESSRSAMDKQIDVGVSFYNDKSTITAITEGTANLQEGETRTQALMKYQTIIGKQDKYTDQQKTALRTDINRDLHSITTGQAELDKTIRGGIAEGLDVSEQLKLIESPAQRQTLQNTADKYNRVEAKKEVDRVAGIRAAEGVLYANPKLDIAYIEYQPAGGAKETKDLDYTMSAGEHLDRVKSNMNFYESKGSILDFKTMKKELSGAVAWNTMWHEVNAIKDEDVRNYMMERLSGIQANPESQDVTYRFETGSKSSLDKQLRPAIATLNDTFDALPSDSKHRKLYIDAFEYISNEFRWNPKFKKEQVAIVKTALKPLNEYKALEATKATVKPKTNQKVSDNDILLQLGL